MADPRGPQPRMSGPGAGRPAGTALRPAACAGRITGSHGRRGHGRLLAGAGSLCPADGPIQGSGLRSQTTNTGLPLTSDGTARCCASGVTRMIAVTPGEEAYRRKRPAASSAEPPTMTSTTIEPQATTPARPAGPRDASRSRLRLRRDRHAALGHRRTDRQGLFVARQRPRQPLIALCAAATRTLTEYTC